MYKTHIKKIIFICLIIGISADAQVSFKDTATRMSREPRYIFMNVGTTGCIYCLMQNKKIAKDKGLVERLSNEVYFVTWDMDTLGKFSFGGKNYCSGKDFIKAYTSQKDGPPAFPLWMVFDSNYNKIYTYSGMLPVKSLLQMLDVVKDLSRPNPYNLWKSGRNITS